MASIFSKDPAEEHRASVYDKIEGEIAHLKKKTGTRDAPGSTKAVPWIASLVILGFIGLYIMDPFLYAMHRNDAVRAYLYLHNYDGNSSSRDLVASRILSTDEIQVLNQREGSFQDYYASPQAAEQQAASIVQYMNGLRTLHEGPYDHLDRLSWIRYHLFVQTGLQPPISWTFLNSTIN